MPRINFRFLILWLIGLAFLIFIIHHFTNLADLLSTLKKSNWLWVVAALVVHLLYYVTYAYLFATMFEALGVKSSTRRLVPLVFTSLFVNIVLPSGGISGTTLFVNEAKSHHQSGAQVVGGMFIVFFVHLLTFIPFVIVSLIFLNRFNHLVFYEIIGTSLFIGLVALMGFSLLLGILNPTWLLNILVYTQSIVRAVGKVIGKPEVLRLEWASETARLLQQSLGKLKENIRRFSKAIAISFFQHTLSLLSLSLLFLAFNQPLDLGAIISAFSFGFVFGVITVIPHTIAAVETVMALILASYGIGHATAIAITLVFGATNLYIPLFFGFYFLRDLKLFRR